MKLTFRHFFLLNKRLYKKPIFVIILALIPILMLSFSTVADSGSGLVRIALAQKDNNDPLSAEIVSSLLSRNGLIYFTESSSPESAVDMVKSGKVDAAWIFPEDTTEKANVFLKKHTSNDYIIDIFQREQTIPLRLSSEVLCREFFRHNSRSMYINYIHQNTPELNHLSDEELLKYYNEFEKNAQLFDFSESENVANKNFLISPLRGLLSVIVLLCGLAATLFFIQDKQTGTFSLVPEEKLPAIGFICQLIAILNVGIVMLISLLISGLSVSFFREIIILILFCISSAAFCSILHLFIKEIKLLGALIPLVVIISITVCPVFFDFNSVRIMQVFLPPTHYINAAYNNTDLLLLALYTVISTGLFIILSKLRFLRLRGEK